MEIGISVARLDSMSKRSLLLSAVLFCFVAAGCAGSGSPVAPGPSSAGGASISGSILSGGSSSAMTSSINGSAINGLVVTVAGTAIKSSVDAAGRFRLDGVPNGDLQLQFTGPVTATIPVPQVQPAETITLVLSLSTTTVTLESQLRSGAGEEQVEGRIESLPPTMPAGSLKVAGRTVTTDASTTFRNSGGTAAFADLEIGFRVHVKGRTSGNNILASSLEIQNTNTTIPVNVNGVIDTLSGSAATFQFKIGSRIVKGDTFTIFFGDGNAARTFADLADGDRVEVKGLQRDGYVYAERIHINGAGDDDDDDQDSSASIQGRVNALAGTPPSLVLTVGTTIVRTTTDTEVKRRGDIQTLAAIRLGPGRSRHRGAAARWLADRPADRVERRCAWRGGGDRGISRQRCGNVPHDHIQDQRILDPDVRDDSVRGHRVRGGQGRLEAHRQGDLGPERRDSGDKG